MVASDQTRRRHPTYLALALLAAALAPRVGPWVIEPDQYRLYELAWRMKNVEAVAAVGDYPARTSYLYVKLLQWGLEFGLSFESLLWIMSLAGALAIFIAGLIFIRQTGDRRPFLAIALLLALPGLNFLSLYGFPTVFSAVAALGILHFRIWNWRVGLAEFLLSLFSLLMKADTVLIFPGVLLYVSALFGRDRFWKTGTSMALACVVFGVFFSSLSSPAAFATSWTATFPFRLAAFFHKYNTAIVLTSGLGLTALAFVLFGYALAKGPRRQAAALLIWFAVPVLFWGFIYGNSVRHLVPGALALPLLILHMTADWPFKRTALVLAGAIVLNVIVPAKAGQVGPLNSGLYMRDARYLQRRNKISATFAREVLAKANTAEVRYVSFFQLPAAIMEVLKADPNVRMVTDHYVLSSGQKVFMYYVPDNQLEGFLAAPPRAATDAIWASDYYSREQLRSLGGIIRTLR